MFCCQCLIERVTALNICLTNRYLVEMCDKIKCPKCGEEITIHYYPKHEMPPMVKALVVTAGITIVMIMVWMILK